MSLLRHLKTGETLRYSDPGCLLDEKYMVEIREDMAGKQLLACRG